MPRSHSLSDLAGNWSGRKQLWFSPEDEALTSEATAAVTAPAGGRFLSIRYTWVYQDELQDGMILFGRNERTDEYQAVFVDSFHQTGEMMICKGGAGSGDALAATGSYAAPPGPDWGWRIEIRSAAPDRIEISMENIPPDAAPERAVLISLERDS